MIFKLILIEIVCSIKQYITKLVLKMYYLIYQVPIYQYTVIHIK